MFSQLLNAAEGLIKMIGYELTPALVDIGEDLLKKGFD